MRALGLLPVLLGAVFADAQEEPRELRKADRSKTCAEYLASFRQIHWYHDFESATGLARETGRPLFLIFCRAGTLLDPATGKPKAAS